MSNYIDLYEFVCRYEAKNDEKLKELVYALVYNASKLTFVKKLCPKIFISKY
jgi:hypothetical protein